MKKSSFFLLLMLLFATVLLAQQQGTAPARPQTTKPATPVSSSGKVFGIIFSDYNYILQRPQTANPGKGTGGENSFDIRRLHLGYEHTFNKDFSTRVIYDPAIASLQEAYLNWDNVFSMHSLMIGMMHTSAEKTTEKFFGYRSLERLVLDKKGYTQEFDKGISLNGKFNPQGSIYYSLAIGNGSGIAPELDKIKKFYFTFGMMPDKASVLELYADYENFSAGRSVITGKLLYAMMMQKYAFGVEAFYSMNRKPVGTKDVVPAGASLFAWFEMMKGIRGVLRVDAVDDDLNNSNATLLKKSYREVYVNVGLDYTPIPEVHLIPNVVYGKLLKKGTSPGSVDNMMVRLTAAIYFPTF